MDPDWQGYTTIQNQGRTNPGLAFFCDGCGTREEEQDIFYDKGQEGEAYFHPFYIFCQKCSQGTTFT
jgi:hypothetical protein